VNPIGDIGFAAARPAGIFYEKEKRQLPLYIPPTARIVSSNFVFFETKLRLFADKIPDKYGFL